MPDPQSDHDVLIEIRTIVRTNQDQFVRHLEDSAGKFSNMNKSLSAIHRRVDWLMVSGVLGITIIVLVWLIKLNGGIG